MDGLCPLPASSEHAPWPTLTAWIALRQGGLRDDLHALAAARGVAGWFEAPLTLFAELPDRLAPSLLPALGETDRLTLLGEILARHPGTLFTPPHDRERWLTPLDRTIGELLAEGISAADFARASAARALGGFERRRDETFLTIFSAYEVALAQHGHRDGRDGLAALARAITEDPAGFTSRLGGRREVRIVGLADLRGGWHALLAALERSEALDQVVILSTHSLPLQSPLIHEPLEAILAPQPARVILEVSDPVREVEEVAERVRALLDAGVPPHEIAVTSRQARPYLDLAATALRRLGVPFSARLRHALRDNAVVRAVDAILVGCADGWTRHALLEVAEHPLLETGLDAEVLNLVGFRRRIGSLDEWDAALLALTDRVRRRARGGEGEFERRERLPDESAIVRTREALGRLRATLEPLTKSHTLREWVTALTALLDTDPFGIRERLHQPVADDWGLLAIEREGWSELRRILTDWARALERIDDETRADAAIFRARLRPLLESDIIQWTEHWRGVQLAEGLAIAFRSFAHLFILGMSSGQFPRRAPISLILEESDRSALRDVGLPLDPREAWSTRERELFVTLCQGARRSLTCSWPSADQQGRETIRSVFLDELAEQEHPPVEEQVAAAPPLSAAFPFSPAAVAQATRAFALEQTRTTGTASPYNGLIEDPSLRATVAEELGSDRVWSASQLETLAKCPWGYFAGRLLRLEPRAEPADEMEPTVRGTILHEALRIFFEQLRDERGAPVILARSERDALLPALYGALDIAWEAEAGNGWLGDPALLAPKRAELRRILTSYLESELDWFEKVSDGRTASSKHIRTGFAEAEVAFTDVTIQAGEVPLRIRGHIDRVDVARDDRIEGPQPYLAAIDYKTSVGSTPGGGKKQAWDDGLVLQLPLYAAVLAVVRPELSVARIEYRVLKDGKNVHLVPLISAEKPEGAKKGSTTRVASENSEAAERVAQALAHAGVIVSRARSGQFPIAPTGSAGCSPYCVGRGICRIPGGPIDPNDRR